MSSNTLPSNTQLSRTNQIIPTLLGGLISGAFLVVLAVSFATLIYAGTPARFAGQGIALVLIGSAALTAILALTSSYPGTIALPQDSPAALIALSTAAMASSMTGQSAEAQFFTVVAMILLGTVTVGIAMFLLGYFRLGRLVRFIPYSVVGGFLAATGWLLLKGGLEILVEIPENADAWRAFFTPLMLIRWLPGLIMALALFGLMRRYRHALIAPVTILAGSVIFFAVLFATQTPLDRAAELHLLIGPFAEGSAWQSPVSPYLFEADPATLLNRVPGLATLAVVSIVSLLLNCSGLELAVGRDLDLNHELRVAGAANIVSGLFGGIPGYHALSVTLITHLIGANSRMAGIIAALVAVAVAIAGDQLLTLFPRAVLGGLIMFLGLHLLVEWVYDAWRRMPRADYAVILLILGIVMLGGYLEAIGVGLLAAAVLFLIDYSRQSVVKQVLTGDTYQSTITRSLEEQRYLCMHGDALLILRLTGYIFFGTANSLLELIQQRLSVQRNVALRFVVFDFRLVTNFDTSAVMSFARMKQLGQNHQFTLVFANVKPEMLERFSSAGNFLADGPVRAFPDLDHAVEWCENQMLRHASVQVRSIGGSLLEQFEESMPAQIAATVIEYLERVELDSGAQLVRQGENARDLFFIETGLLSVRVKLDSGDTVRVRTVTSGAVLGEIAFYLGTERTASIVAEEPSVIYTLSRSALERLENEHPSVASALHRYLAGRLAQGLADNATALRAALA